MMTRQPAAVACPFGVMCRATGFCQFYHPPCIDQQATAKRKTSVAGDVSRDTPSPLLAKLPEIEEGVARKMIPAERTVMLHMVSRAVQAAMDSVILTARIQIQRNQPLDDKLAAQIHGMQWCRIAALDLSKVAIGAEGAARMAAVLQ